MELDSTDIVPLNQVRARFSELAESVRGGEEKIITKNGESYVALIDARRLDHYHRLERQHLHLLLLDEAMRGLTDVAAGHTQSVAELKKKYLGRKSNKKARKYASDGASRPRDEGPRRRQFSTQSR